MNLNRQEVAQFYRIWWSLLGYTNNKYKCVKEFNARTLGDHVSLSDATKIREKLVEDVSIIDQFVKANPEKLSKEDLVIASSWKYGIFGEFYVTKYLKNYSIFLTKDMIYGVVGLVSPLSEIIQQPLPQYVQTFLLPYKDKIIYDGLLGMYGMQFSKSVRTEIDNTYKILKAEKGIALSLNK